MPSASERFACSPFYHLLEYTKFQTQAPHHQSYQLPVKYLSSFIYHFLPSVVMSFCWWLLPFPVLPLSHYLVLCLIVNLNNFRVRYRIVDTKNHTVDTKFLTRPQTFLANSPAKFQRPTSSRTYLESRVSCLTSKCNHKSTATNLSCTKKPVNTVSTYLNLLYINSLQTWK